ncbi:hypothetical protein BJ170DRAFT_711875 [Xylariales sp. AK1849]|nr:hypothetical protein BJ170DRAFT_711875 [Xylariales sp. AK1849]
MNLVKIAKVVIMGTAVAASCFPMCRKSINDCLNDKEVPIRTSSDPDWDDYVHTYNIRLPFRPCVVVLPKTSQHIADAVVCAGNHSIQVQSKSGGHSYASYSNGGFDGAMMIHLHHFKDVSVDEKTGIAKVGAGLRLGPLSVAIYNQAKRALAHGTCSGVGIGGHYTHGGYGHFSRSWGLAVDQIVGLDVVLANGSAIYVDENDYPDVYYAMRGAAESFGIITAFYLQTRPAPETVVYFSYDLKEAATNEEKAIQAFWHIQDFARNSPVTDRHISFGIVLTDGGFSVGGTYLGSLEVFQSTVAPELLRGVPTPTSSRVEENGWINTLKILAGDDLDIPEPYELRSNFYAKSVTVPEPGMTEDALESYFRYIFHQGKEAPVDWYAIIDLYGGNDSQISTRGVDFAAFRGRNLTWVAQHQGFVDNKVSFPDIGIAFVNGLNDAMTKGLPEYGAYINYVDSGLTADEAHRLYFGWEMYHKLKVIKGRVDPDNVFANPQTI